MPWIAILFLAIALPAWTQSDSTAQKAQQARDLVVNGNPEQAIPLYEELIQQAPDNATLILNLAIAQFQAGRYKDAITQTQRALQLQPDLLAAHLFLGASHLKSGDAAKAVAPLEHVVQIQPDDRNASLMLAEAFLGSAQNLKAARHFLKTAILLPNEPRVWYGLARACRTVANEHREQLAEDSPYKQALEGDAALSTGQYAAAIQHYQQTSKANDAAQNIGASTAAIYRTTGHDDWAKRIDDRIRKLPAPDCQSAPLACAFKDGDYNAVLKAESATAQALYWQAKTCLALNNQALDKLKTLPDSSQRHELEAQNLEDRGIFREAANHWQQALKFDPTNRTIQTSFATALYRAGDFANALPRLQELVREESSAELNFLTGSAMLLSEQPHEALPYLQKAAAADPNSLAAKAALGQALLATGSPDQAIPYLTAALPIDDDGRLSFQLARAYQITRQPEKARESIAQYQQKRKAHEAPSQSAAQIPPPE